MPDIAVQKRVVRRLNNEERHLHAAPQKSICSSKRPDLLGQILDFFESQQVFVKSERIAESLDFVLSLA